MPIDNFRFYDDLARILAQTGAKTATKYISPTHVIRATRRTYRGNKGRTQATRMAGLRMGKIEIAFTEGKPNFEAREYIKLLKFAEVTFPLRKIQLKFCKRK